MLEITYTDAVLFIWASVMTGLFFKARQEERIARTILMHLMENKEARDQMVTQFNKVKEESQ